MVRLGFVLGLALVSGLHAQLPAHVQRDLIKKDIAAAFREQRWRDLLTHTAKARGLGLDGGEVAYFEAKAQVALGRHAAATKSLEVAFQELAPGTPWYDDALEMYREAKAEAAAAKAARKKAAVDAKAARERAAAEAKRQEQARVKAAEAATQRRIKQVLAARTAENSKHRGYYEGERRSNQGGFSSSTFNGTVVSGPDGSLDQGHTVKDWTGQTFVYLPPGVYQMRGEGDPDPGAPVLVRIRKGFWMATRELTRKQYFIVPGANWLSHGAKSEPKENSLPMTGLTYSETLDYISRLNAEGRRANWLPEGWEYRLPSEAEWEYGLRPRENRSPEKHTYRWHAGNAQGPKHVGMNDENAWGLHDMLGNVSELVADPWHPSFAGRPRDQSVWTAGAVTQTVRFVDGAGRTTSSTEVPWRTLRGGSYTHALEPWKGRQGLPDSQLGKPWVGLRLVIAPRD
jgi:formylglycine-generating enzyme required for sulfatase activity